MSFVVVSSVESPTLRQKPIFFHFILAKILPVVNQIANTAVAALLAPAGVLLFAERLTPIQLAGIGACVVGLVLINYR